MPAGLALLVIILKWPILHVPYYWDEAGAYFYPSFWASSRELFAVLPGHHPPEMFFGHPPLLYLLMAALFKLFGHAPTVAHLPIVLFAAMGVAYTYKLGELLFDRYVAVGAALLLFSTPLYFSQAGMLLGDIPVAACGVATVYYYLTNRIGRYLLFGCAAVMIKEHAALLILMLVLYESGREAPQILQGRHRLLHAFPLLVLGIFFVVQKAMTGAFIPNPYFDRNPLLTLSVPTLAYKCAFVVYWALFAQGRFLLTVLAGAALWRFRRSLPPALLFLGLLAGGYIVAYTGIYFLPRYLLIIVPYICLAGSAAVALLAGSRTRFALVLTILAAIQIFCPDVKNRGNRETTMQYLDVVSLHQKAAAYMERTAPAALIYSPWPLSSMLSDAAFGYVGTPLRTTLSPDSEWRYLILTTEADKDQAAAMASVVSRGGVEKVAHFEVSGKTLDVYSRCLAGPGSDSP